MRTSATEHLELEQMMLRLGTTLSALMHDQIEVTRRYLDSGAGAQGDPTDLTSIVELSLRVVERSADWLELGEIASLALDVRESLAQIPDLRPGQREEMIAHARVSLEHEERLASRLRTDGFAALLEHAEYASEAVDRVRQHIGRARVQNQAAARGIIDEAVPEVDANKDLLALSFEIKNVLVHQNERINQMSAVADETLRAAQSAAAECHGFVLDADRRKVAPDRFAAEQLDEEKLHRADQALHEVASGTRVLAQDFQQLLGIQYSLERRARDLDEHLLWEFLEPLDRHVDALVSAVNRGRRDRSVVLTVRTGGVGFEPEVGAILLPLLERVLEGATPVDRTGRAGELRLLAAREGLEARVALEGIHDVDGDALRRLEEGLEALGGFVEYRRGSDAAASLRVQFPMARSFRSFLIVEASGRRIALPWSAIERVVASPGELEWNTGRTPESVVPLASLFETFSPESRNEEDESSRPVAVLRCGGGSAVVGFDRIVWKESARLVPLPPRLAHIEGVLGGIVGPDGTLTVVLHPVSIVRRAENSRRAEMTRSGEAPAGADAS